KQILVASGLYTKEAEAMIKTWRGSWFEEGLRVFYILPRPTTDTVLPVTIEPRPAELVRVLVGRAEVVTPEMEKQVQRQVSLLGDPSLRVREAALHTIRRYGRFSEPILKRVLEDERNDVVRRRLRELIDKPS
ncbi:MAG TPA: HEAT repeat domain-containing protein, partial [Pyrinomonadaceae bacterium]|nr:HEAT repeat domain-containing protein [Pyrinomonadaceae bacterium]